MDGRPVLVESYVDISQRKRAEQELSDSKALVEAVVENIPNMIFLKEAKDLRFLVFNRAGEDLLGYDRKDLLGKNNLDLFPPEQAAHFMAKDREVLESAEGMLDIPEEPIQTAKQGQRLLHTKKVCIRGADGNTKYLLGISEDITDRKKSEEELRKSEEKFRLITENTADTITVMDLGFKITYVSPSILKLRGYTVQEAMAQSVDQIILPEYLPKINKLFAEQMALEAGGQADPSRTIVMELEEYCKNGSTIWAEVTMSFLRDKDFKQVGIVTITRDITEHKRAEKLQDALYHISEAAVKSDDLETLYAEIHKSVSELISTRNFYIALYHEKEDLLSFPYFVDEVDPAPQPRKLANGLTEYVLRSGTPLLASPVVLNLLVEQGKVNMVGTPAIDWAGVPLKVGNKTLGVLVVQSYHEDIRFGAEALSMLNFVSDNIALAIARKNDEEERKKLVSELRKLSSAVEQSTSVIVIADLEGSIEYANPAFEKITGYAMNEVLGKNPRILKSGEFPPEEYRRLWETISAGGEWRGQFHNKRKDGSLYWEQAVISGIRDSEGKIVKYLAVKEDITERKMMEDELKTSEAQNRVLVDSAGRAGEAIVMLQNAGDIQAACLVANQETVRITGYSQEELKRIGWLDLVHPRYREASQKRMGDRMNKIDVPGIYEISLVSKYGVEIPVEVTGSPVQYQGRPAIVGFFREISERKQAELEREAMITELTAALANIKQLKGLIPICASCKKIRNDGGYWQQVEEYVADHTEADFSHGLCDECAHKLYPDYFPDKKNEENIPPPGS
jgi:PAS domain S-box-containing protein